LRRLRRMLKQDEFQGMEQICRLNRSESNFPYYCRAVLIRHEIPPSQPESSSQSHPRPRISLMAACNVVCYHSRLVSAVSRGDLKNLLLKSFRLDDSAVGRNANLTDLTIGGVSASDLVGVQLSRFVKVFPGLVELDARDPFLGCLP